MSTEHNPSKTVGALLALACVLTGFLAGENMFRYFLEVPGWRHIDIINWGEYSRHADLGIGLFLWPFEAIVGALLLLWTTIVIRRNKPEFRRAALPVYLSLILAVLGLGLTFFAAPYMLGLRNMGNDPVLLKYTFDQFHYWGGWRALMQILAFLSCTWGMSRLIVKV